MADSVKGYPSAANEERVGSEQANVVPVSQYMYALGVYSLSHAYEVGTDAVEASSTTSVINATSHSAGVGDIILFTSGNLTGQAVHVYAADTNTITLAQTLSEAPATSDAFSIRRFIPAKVDSDGVVQTSSSGGSGSTEYTEGDTDASITGVAQLAEAPSNTLEPLQLTASNELKVSIENDSAGLATASNQTTANSSLSTIAGDTTSLDGKITACDTGNVTGTVTANAGTNLNTSALALEAGGNLDAIAGDTTSLDGKVTACDTGAVVVASSALPSGAATAGNQTTANASLSNIETDVNTTAAGFAAEGAALGSGVLLQGDDGTNRKNLSVDATTGDLQVDVTNTVTVSGTVSVNEPVSIDDNGGSLTVDGTVAATQSGTWNVNDISGTISLPTGAATSALQTTGNASLSTIAGDTTSLDGKVTACDTSNIAGSVTANAGTNLNTSALALETGGNLATTATNTGNIDGKITACNTGAVTVASSALPTGAATSALQTTGNSSLSTIAGDTTSIDGKITACNTGAVTVSSSALPTGAATSALQTTGNSSLSTIAGDTTSLDGKVATCDTDDVRQSTHDNLNLNANLQVGDADVSDSNPVPTSVRRSSSTTLVSAVTFNNTTTSDTSSSVDCRDYRDGVLYYDLSKANSPTSIQMTIQGSYDNSTWFNIGDSYLNQLLFDDSSVGSGLDEYVRVPQLPPYIRLQTDATGTTASATFTLTATWTMTD